MSIRAVWLFPLVMGSIFVALLTTFYIGSAVNPLGNLHGLPVGVVNQDRGVTIGTRRIDIGQSLQSGLSQSQRVSGPLMLTHSTLPAAEKTMDRGASYATVIIPPGFTASILTLAAVPGSRPGLARPAIVILTNQRAGTQGVGLATGILDPALAAASRQIGRQLTAIAPAPANAATRAFLADPVTVMTAKYRPLPPNTALGLSAFYVALLTLFCGFLGGTIVNSSVDAALGYATTETGPWWRQRRPVPINRWQTLLTKWVLALVLTALMTGILLLVAVAGLGLYAPHVGLLWLVTWLCAASVAAGTLVLFAILGTVGQLVALIIFVYAGLASAGGTVPIQALPTPLRWLAQVEPLRQVVDGTRAILYLNAQADAGLTRAVVAASAGLVFWLIVGAVVVRWYDARGLSRIDPELLAYVHATADSYKSAINKDSQKESGTPDKPSDPDR
ncbi:MAG TPA: ABC transporter permease [Streptosporangiaceae bacterium]|nr:ABC transporter permease [Streptosporangiaceae bacterium]